MTITVTTDTRPDLLERKRSVLMQRLTRVLDSLDRRRHHAQEVVANVLPSTPSAATRDRAATVVTGALVGGAVFVAAMVVQSRLRARHAPINVLRRAVHTALETARPVSPFKHLGRRVVGSVVVTLASEVARIGARNLLEEAVEDPAAHPEHRTIIHAAPAASAVTPTVALHDLPPIPQPPHPAHVPPPIPPAALR